MDTFVGRLVLIRPFLPRNLWNGCDAQRQIAYSRLENALRANERDAPTVEFESLL